MKIFSCGYCVDMYGNPKLGKGSEAVGFATKTTIRRLKFAAQYMIHLDATFKLNSKGFPVIAIGVSDMWRQFHLVSMFLVSDTKQPQWEIAIRSALDMYVRITGEMTYISYVMMDSDAAQRNAFDAVAFQFLDVEQGPKFIMCLFHVMQNVKKHTSQLSQSKQQSVYRHGYSIHSTRDHVKMKSRIQIAVKDWKGDPELHDFCSYFILQWITSPYRHWQCIETPMGMAKTNNPIENFNGHFKQHKTQRHLLRLNVLFTKLLECCTLKYVLDTPFQTETRTVPGILRGFHKLHLEKALSIEQVPDSAIAVSNGNLYKVFQYYKPVTLARKPSAVERGSYGNSVRSRVTTCSRCRTWFKLGCCVHLTAVQLKLGMTLHGTSGNRPVFEDKRRKRKRGRPAQAGPALSLH
ncbi:Hypothetical protein PHPALM_11504 [Phytophthora palmivora]|uniref:MULE transposase domain-containing protein n=1 Tax=Phytophthora palmivora TaxID=4796 RepID=A0A2P4Y239_9STRA|nr:Hypothetical protein PHPALM_11504 [Phytophthora palmivora]